MSIDRRVRSGLHEAAESLTSAAPAALRAVEARARRRMRMARTARLAVAAASVVAVAVGLPAAIDRFRDRGPELSPAASLTVGTYIVDVAESDLARAEGMVGRWTVTLRPDGVVDLVPPDSFVGSISGVSYVIDGDLVRTDAFLERPGCQFAEQVGTYRWTRTATALHFSAVSDTCAARTVLFTNQPWEVTP